MEHEEQAERMAEDADRMEQHSEQLGERIDDIQSDWERKEQDTAVPGARPEESTMSETPDQSDQLPEEAPPGAVPDDDPESAGTGSSDNPGVPGEEETSTGNPDNAGADE
jgi:hypothetical protein